jgi:hypothetical protein
LRLRMARAMVEAMRGSPDLAALGKAAKRT